MASVTYTAKRNIASGHVLNTEYDLDFTASQLNRMNDTKRIQRMSLNGTTETLRYTGLEYYQVTANEIHIDNIPYFREFLESVDGGETFVFDPYGTAASPDNPISQCILESNSYTEARINTSSYFNISFRIRVL